MPAREGRTPQRTFLLRGSLFLAGMLFLWWLALVDPLLAVLRVSADLPLRCLPGAAQGPAVRALPAGDWVFRVPVPSSLLTLSTTRQTPRFRGVQLELPQTNLILFTLGFPIFWALVLAWPGGWLLWRVLLRGTAFTAVIAVAQVFLFIGYTINTNLHLITNGVAVWLLAYLNYVNTYLIPYAAPFCVVLGTHRKLRSEILGWCPQMAPPPAKGVPS